MWTINIIIYICLLVLCRIVFVSSGMRIIFWSFIIVTYTERTYQIAHVLHKYHRWIQGVPLATEPGISLIILQLMRILQRNLKRTTDTFVFISHTTNILLFKFRCNIFIGVTIVKEMLGSVASGTHCITVRCPYFQATGISCRLTSLLTLQCFLRSQH